MKAKFIFSIGILKTLRFNFKYLPFKKALKFPFLISKNIYLHTLSGEISLPENAKYGCIKIGFGDVGVFDKSNSRGVWEVSGKIIFKGTSNIGHGTKISVGKQGILELGDKFIITAESQIVCNKRITFGNNCLLSWDCLIMDTDFHKIYDNTGLLINSPTPIYISDNVWIGCRNLILKGSVIPENSVIGANSTVNKDLLQESGLFVGSPARLIKKDISWEI